MAAAPRNGNKETAQDENRTGPVSNRRVSALPVNWPSLLFRRDRLPLLRAYLRIWRSGMFDRKWYWEQNPDVQARRADTLLHYLLRGASEGRKPNEIFDGRWYLETYSDVAAEGVNPLLHYVLDGAAEGRNPSADFSVQEYLEQNSDVAASGMHPVVHYLKFGRDEGRSIGFYDYKGSRRPAPRPVAPDSRTWHGLAERGHVSGEPATVDVVIPVYAGFDDTLACVHSVLTARNRTSHEVVVIDDCSPEPALSEMLGEIASLGLITLIRNERNMGFVGTANRGMKLHPDRDVILLNSDTVVYGDWLDRMVAHAGEGVGTVTPLSTNATICSYPVINRNNYEQLEISFDELDRICAEVNAAYSVEVPTGVGFCMLLKRKMLDQVGCFDEANFGRGYGEENDLCRRALASGWKNVMAADTFVRHTGEVSFAASSKEEQRKGMSALLRKHPDYMTEVKAYIERDPVAPMRRRIDARRFSFRYDKNILFVSHTWGGGIERHIRDMSRMLARSGVGVIVMRPRFAGGLVAAFGSSKAIHVPNLKQVDLRQDFPELVELMRIAGIIRIHVHSLAGWGSGIFNILPALADTIAVPMDFTFHDFMPICPRINMVTVSGRFCGGPEPEKCRACLRDDDEFSGTEIEAWQTDFRKFIAHTRRRFAPSRDTADRLSSFLDGMTVDIRPHPERSEVSEPLSVPISSEGVLRVAIPGAVGLHKGAEVLYRAASHARLLNLPIEYVVVGYTDRDPDFEKLGNVRITGLYSYKDFREVLARERCHLAMIPSVWPETYSYTLSELLTAGFHVAVFPFGAQYERLIEIAPHLAIRLPMEALDDPAIINRCLLESRNDIVAGREREIVKLAQTYTYSSYYETADD